MRRPGGRQAASKRQELAMHIGEGQHEFEILPTEQEQPVVVPEDEPPRQPQDTPA
jgi:hypothetical protein